MSLLRQPKWIVGHLLAAVLVFTFVRLGMWQLDRHAQHVERNELLEARLAEPAVPLRDLLAEATGAVVDLAVERREPADGDAAPAGRGDAAAIDAANEPTPGRLAFRRVELIGRYAPEHEVLVRNRTYQGLPGWHVLTPFVPAGEGWDGDGGDAPAILVDRGWVPQAVDEPPVADAPPPEGTVELRGVLVPEQDPPSGPLSGLAASDPADGPLERIFLIDVERLARQVPYRLVDAYLVPTASSREQTGELPVAPEPPSPEAAPHLGYAVQWFIFAAIGAVGYVLLLRQRLRESRSEQREA